MIRNVNIPLDNESLTAGAPIELTQQFDAELDGLDVFITGDIAEAGAITVFFGSPNDPVAQTTTAVPAGAANGDEFASEPRAEGEYGGAVTKGERLIIRPNGFLTTGTASINIRFLVEDEPDPA